MPLPVLNKLVWEEKMSEQPKTKAMKSASTGSTCAFLGIILGGPLLGIPAIILGIQALKSMTEVERKQGLDGPKEQALVAIIGGILASVGWIGYLIYRSIR